MEEMVKRLARAICAAYGDEYDEQPADLTALEALRRREKGSRYDGIHPHDPGLPTQADWDECARAALQAMGEPTDAMLEAGLDCGAWGPIGDSRVDADEMKCWRAMIEAALSEG